MDPLDVLNDGPMITAYNSDEDNGSGLEVGEEAGCGVGDEFKDNESVRSLHVVLDSEGTEYVIPSQPFPLPSYIPEAQPLLDDQGLPILEIQGMAISDV